MLLPGVEGYASVFGASPVKLPPSWVLSFRFRAWQGAGCSSLSGAMASATGCEKPSGGFAVVLASGLESAPEPAAPGRTQVSNMDGSAGAEFGRSHVDHAGYAGLKQSVAVVFSV